jgi:hypothetical protein
VQTAGSTDRPDLRPPSPASALYGVLAEIEALGLDLLEIQRLTPDRKSPEPGDRRSP